MVTQRSNRWMTKDSFCLSETLLAEEDEDQTWRLHRQSRRFYFEKVLSFTNGLLRRPLQQRHKTNMGRTQKTAVLLLSTRGGVNSHRSHVTDAVNRRLVTAAGDAERVCRPLGCSFVSRRPCCLFWTSGVSRWLQSAMGTL